jgi:beta-lactam-binding protein with PASTA domain
MVESFLKKIWNHPIGRHIVLLICIPVFLILIISTYLRIYTHHGQALAVPDFSNLSLKDAKELAEARHLKCQVSDSVFLIDRKPGTIVDQHPKHGSKVKRNRHIFFTINAFHPEKVEMPNIVGVSLRQAKAILESNGLSVGHIRYVPDIATNSVLKQIFKNKIIDPGRKIAKGSKIELVLGRSSGEETAQVPDLMGLNLSAASQVLTEAYLNIGAIVYDNTVITETDTINAVIKKQKPIPGKGITVNLGSYVDLWLTVKEDNSQKNYSDEDHN